MSTLSLETTPQQQRELERFYFHEARLLDNRQYRQWLALLSEDIRYLLPSRVNVQVDNRERGQESMISVARELEGEDSMGCPLREENYLLLSLRAERAYKINSWSESPPARTRRLVGNIELLAREDGGGADEVAGAVQQLSTVSNFHLYYTRPGSENVLYSGQRCDTLAVTPAGFRLRRREVILDYATIDLPTLGLFF
ncbi:MAG: aromatic-ring-hydroxylating dioxygenase subunit beta [Halioglobus sp.]|nr:aromatic-ring-hydroxylating dioxygenase subunit beta [Halioglobus sp.]